MLLLHQSISPSQIIVFHQNLHQKKIKSRQSWAADPKNFPTNGPRFKKTYRTSYRARQSTTTTAVLSPSGHHITFTTYRGYPFKTLASCALGPGYALAETPRYHRSPAEIREREHSKERTDRSCCAANHFFVISPKLPPILVSSCVWYTGSFRVLHRARPCPRPDILGGEERERGPSEPASGLVEEEEISARFCVRS